MTQAGGPAALNGFLYQILHHIDWLASARLANGSGNSHDPVFEYSFEPIGGGDAQQLAAKRYVVEQYKSRSSTLSVSDIEAALKDLLKSSRPQFGAQASYRIVTNARPGRIGSFHAFQQAVQAVKRPSLLDRGKKIRIGSASATHRQYFEQLQKKTSATAKDVGHVLGHLELVFEQHEALLIARLERVLRRFSPELGSTGGAGEVIERLLGILLGRLAKGELQLDKGGVTALLEQAGLRPDRGLKIAELPLALATRTTERLEATGYKAAMDVRESLEIGDADVVVLAGPSGSGKSWALARCLLAWAAQGRPQTLHTGAPTENALLERVGADVWHQAMNETSVRPWTAVVQYLREFGYAGDMLVAVDDVQDASAAEKLATTNWREHGLRLVMSVPEHVARRMAELQSARMRLHTLGEFSIDELECYLRRNGREWAELPSDLKRILRQPILAGLFVRLPTQPQGTATLHSEYEIFEAFWRGVQRRGRSGDEGILLAIADRYCADVRYPVPRAEWTTVGLSDAESAERLATTGWVRIDASGGIGFAHDRLLNWAAAISLAERYSRGELTATNVVQRATGGGQLGRAARFNRLGYLPMDVLWLVAGASKAAVSAHALLKAFEGSRVHRHELYAQLIPTLGARIAPALVCRLDEASQDKKDQQVIQEVGGAIAAICTDKSIDSKTIVHDLLHSGADTQNQIALRVLVTRPDPSLLDTVWRLHQRHWRALQDKGDPRRYGHYDSSFSALRSCVGKEPAWLRKRLLAVARDSEPTAELAFQLFHLRSPLASEIWCEVRTFLLHKLCMENPRALLYCVSRFGDIQDSDFVVGQLSNSDGSVASAAYIALSSIDAARAIKELHRTTEGDLTMSSRQWMPILIHRDLEGLQVALLNLVSCHSGNTWLIENLFSDSPDAAGTALLHQLLRSTTARVSSQLAADASADFFWVTRPVEFMLKISDPLMLDVLRAEPGLALGAQLADLELQRRRHNSRTRDALSTAIKNFLLTTGSPELGRVVEHQLASPHYWVRHDGLLWAYTRCTPQIVQELVSIARKAFDGIPDQREDASATLELHLAATALAAIGSDAELVDLVATIGSRHVPRSLASLRAFKGPTEQSLTHSAMACIASAEVDDEVLVGALVLAWMSADAEFVRPVRALLERADPRSQVAQFCCITLSQLGDSAPGLLELVQRVLETKENALWAIELLVVMGEAAVPCLQRWVQNHSSEDPTTAVRLLRSLRDTSASAFVARTAATMCLSDSKLVELPFDLVAQGVGPAVIDELLYTAFAPTRSTRGRTLQAIEGLARLDTSRAVRAALLALDTMAEGERQLCSLVLRCSPTGGVPLLLEAALRLRRPSLLDEVGRALRQANAAHVDQALRSMLQGDARQDAARISGWCASPALLPWLRNLASAERILETRSVLLEAILRHEREAHVLQLLERLGGADAAGKWSILTTILESADSFLLTDSQDRLWLGRPLSAGLPAIYQHHANEKLRAAQKKIDSERKSSP